MTDHVQDLPVEMPPPDDAPGGPRMTWPGRKTERAEPRRPRRRVRWAMANPRRVILVWAILTLVLGTAGLFAKSVLHPEDLMIRGTPSAEAIEHDRVAFGKNSPVTILLEGPARQLNAAGPKLVDEISKLQHVSVANPWAAGAPEMLRERPDRVLLVVSIDKDVIDAGRDVLPKVQQKIDQHLPKQIESYVAGEPRFSTELVDLVFAGALKAEILSIPFLLLILLLIFRAPIAAAIPLVQGLAVIGVTTGFVTLLGLLMPVNILAQASGSIIGLALGVDYSLLFVSRFRDELRAGCTVPEAVENSMNTAGRTVLFAGGILVLAGLVVIAVSFGWASMTTGTIGVVSAAVFSVVAAYTLLPACLLVIGENIDRWQIGSTGKTALVVPAVNRIIDRPVLASALTLIPLLLLCGVALGLQTGGPDLKMFKPDNPMRSDVETVADRYGGGVMAPYVVVVSAHNQPVTSPANIRALEQFQRSLAADPSVSYVIGPATTSARRLADGTENAGTNLARLDVGLGAASIGARKLRRGLDKASGGAGQLAGAGNQAQAGARQLQSGLGSAALGADQLSAALKQSASGSRQLENALAQLARGATQLRSGMREAKSTAGGIRVGVDELQRYIGDTSASLSRVQSATSQATTAVDQAIAALDSLPAAVQSDPAVVSARGELNAARGSVGSSGGDVQDAIANLGKVDSAVQLGETQADTAVSGINKLSSGVDQLTSGARQIAASSGKLSSGLGQLSTGSSQLSAGLYPLLGGSRQLADGLGGVGSGSGELSKGLSRGEKSSASLSRGVSRASQSVSRLRREADAQGQVDLADVGRSPYLAMALLSSAPEEQKRNLRLVLNEQNGGTSARVFVLTDELPTSKSMEAFNDRLVKGAAGLG
ncbi:MAG: MMPL family transporter, partial [Actinobacteria bacterium]|nr:MMPL family transporter [Actinomycetota bacterium]